MTEINSSELIVRHLGHDSCAWRLAILVTGRHTFEMPKNVAFRHLLLSDLNKLQSFTTNPEANSFEPVLSVSIKY